MWGGHGGRCRRGGGGCGCGGGCWRCGGDFGRCGSRGLGGCGRGVGFGGCGGYFRVAVGIGSWGGIFLGVVLDVVGWCEWWVMGNGYVSVVVVVVGVMVFVVVGLVAEMVVIL